MGRIKENPCRKYYEFHRAENKNKCKICDFSMTGDHASNLERHLKRYHLKEFEEIQQMKKRKLNERNEPNLIESKSQETTKSTANSNYLYVKLERKTLIDACVELITVNGCSLELLEYSGFRKIINPLIEAIGDNFSITLDSIRQMIPDMASKIKSHLIDKIHKKIISLKLDIATKSDRSVLGVNVQFVDQGKIHLHTLSIKELKDRHPNHLKNTVYQILERYYISPHQIYTIITDNGAGMLTGEQDEYNREYENFQISLNDECYTSRLVGVKCVIQEFHSSVEDAINNPEMEEFFSECRELVRQLRISSLNASFEENNIKQPNLDCYSNWYSTYRMLDSLSYCQSLCNALAASDLLYFLPGEKWKILKTILETLGLIRNVAMTLQSEQLTITDFFGLWIETKIKLERYDNDFAFLLIKQLNAHEKILMEDKSMLAAMYLDPRFQILLSSQQKITAKYHLKEIWSVRDYFNSSKEEKIKDNSVTDIAIEDDDELEVFLKNKEKDDRSRNGVFKPVIENIIVAFDGIERMNRKKNVLEFWEENKYIYPQLYQLAIIIFSVPVTQNSFRKASSGLNFVLRENKDSSYNEMLEDIQLIRANLSCLR
ncbi:uncharacterized protein LOC111641809 [Centruroides sculpturatus]|uniref:uncharacterized protein LOC111641809 n=1 Tax=Centruroides sculpturatus TaxID=218467 RepID=UPI000C6CD32A|nr:uncharacterized protein LOC111641809 [Centruroides sculpturatus]XP_023243811.1 uncharacterized protein LOC111641809 [Centruroides sculpturatus]